MSDTIVWISGATEGLGLGLANTVPYPGARIINLSRREHPTFETVLFDLTRPETYASVAESLQILGDLFLRTIRPGYESGLVLMSSAAARHPFLGGATYGAAKAGMEMWVRIVKRELECRQRDTWVVAVRPGFVDTPTTRAAASATASDYPVGPQIARQLESREGVMTPEEAGRAIWAGLPPMNRESLLLFGEMVTNNE